MESFQGSHTGSHWLIGLAACLASSGCVQPDAVKTHLRAAVLSPEFKAAVTARVKAVVGSPEFKAEIREDVMQAATQSGGFNIGNIVLNSSGIWMWAVLLLLVFLLWRRGRKAVKTADMLIGQMEECGLSKDEKYGIMNSAIHNRIGPFLEKRLRKVRKKMKKGNGDGETN